MRPAKAALCVKVSSKSFLPDLMSRQLRHHQILQSSRKSSFTRFKSPSFAFLTPVLVPASPFLKSKVYFLSEHGTNKKFHFSSRTRRPYLTPSAVSPSPDEMQKNEAKEQQASTTELSIDHENTEIRTHNSESGKAAENKNEGDEGIQGMGLFAWMWTRLKRMLRPGGFLWGLFAGVAVSVAVLFGPQGFGNGDSSLREKVTLFNFILQDINTSYVDQVDINKLFETGVNSMLGTLDPYTQFENNTQAIEMSVKTNGRYAGVGLGISLGEIVEGGGREVVVVSAFEGYAFDAGIRPGDVIVTIGGKKVMGMSLEQVTDSLRGEPGTNVTVGIRREGKSDLLPFTLSRQNVHIRVVPAAAFVGDGKDWIGYIRLQSFSKDAASEVRNALLRLSAEAERGAPDGKLHGLVLDLRGNPGGLLNAAIDVAEIFLRKDEVIVSTRGRGLGPGPTYKSSADPLLPTGLPLAVLVNGQTASASEIVAGSVQDLDRGVIVGSRTFGKGLVQNVKELPFSTALKYTVGKYYTPSGRCIQALNYQQSNDDGPVEAMQVEESERKEFTTKGGRIVRDGGGIEPDIDIQSRPSFLEVALQRQNMYFRFANRFGAELKKDVLPDDFEITDAIYRDFVKFLGGAQFKYESKFDEAFAQLDEMYKDVGYDSARVKVNDLKKATQMDMKSDFLRHEHEIRAQIESAIRYRFQPDSERIVAELKNDEQLAEAIRIIKDPADYRQLLSPATSSSEKEGTPVAVGTAQDKT